MQRFLLCLFGVILAFPSFSQRKLILNAVDKKLDSARHYQRILIVGEGGMQSRMFLDFLSEELIKDLKDQDIVCKYEYLGDPHKTNTEESLKKAVSWEHDAILRFYPLATFESVNVVQTQTPYGPPVYNSRGASTTPPARAGYSLSSQQYLVNDFDIVLNENKETIWSAKLYSAIEFGRNTVYKRIRKMILSDMEKQNVLQK